MKYNQLCISKTSLYVKGTLKMLYFSIDFAVQAELVESQARICHVYVMGRLALISNLGSVLHAKKTQHLQVEHESICSGLRASD